VGFKPKRVPWFRYRTHCFDRSLGQTHPLEIQRDQHGIATQFEAFELDFAPPLGQTQMTDTWKEVVESTVKKCELAATLHQELHFNDRGAEALGKMIKKMAERLDEQRVLINDAADALQQFSVLPDQLEKNRVDLRIKRTSWLSKLFW
jgi:hypothetical protein